MVEVHKDIMITGTKKSICKAVKIIQDVKMGKHVTLNQKQFSDIIWPQLKFINGFAYSQLPFFRNTRKVNRVPCKIVQIEYSIRAYLDRDSIMNIGEEKFSTLQFPKFGLLKNIVSI